MPIGNRKDAYRDADGDAYRKGRDGDAYRDAYRRKGGCL